MKQRSRAYRGYPTWRQRELRPMIWAVSVGGIAAAVTGLIVWLICQSKGN